jgi:hypothetical protein
MSKISDKRSYNDDIDIQLNKKYKNNTYSRSELSGMIQWLIDLAGTDCIIEQIINKFTNCKNIKIINVVKLPNKPRAKTIYYISPNNNVGHWIYYSSDRIEYNSYKLGHQNPGTNQFCQSFAIMYMLFDVGKSSLSDLQPSSTSGKSSLSDLQPSSTSGKSSLSDLQPSSTSGKSSLSDLQPSSTSRLDENNDLIKTNLEINSLFEHKLEWDVYIIKIINMWEYFLNNGLKDIIILESIRIDAEYNLYNLENKRITSKYVTFSQDSNNESELNENWIKYKLQKIKNNAKQIALNT